MEPQAIAEQMTLAKFVETYPNVITIGGLRWQVHHAATNGLELAGAVLRIRNSADAKRAAVRIIPKNYFAWQAKGGAA